MDPLSNMTPSPEGELLPSITPRRMVTLLDLKTLMLSSVYDVLPAVGAWAEEERVEHARMLGGAQASRGGVVGVPVGLSCACEPVGGARASGGEVGEAKRAWEAGEEGSVVRVHVPIGGARASGVRARGGMCVHRPQAVGGSTRGAVTCGATHRCCDTRNLRGSTACASHARQRHAV